MINQKRRLIILGFLALILVFILYITLVKAPINLEDASIVEDNTVRTSGRLTLKDASGQLLKYYVLHNRDRERIPVLLHVSFDYEDQGKTEPISKSIQNFSISIFGVTDFESGKPFEDGNYYYSQMFFIDNDGTFITASRDNEPEIAYLKQHFDTIKIDRINKNQIQYTSEQTFTSNQMTVSVGRDPTTEALYISVTDSADVIYITD